MAICTLAGFLAYFQKTKPSQISWAHRVNNHGYLRQVLADPSVDIIEADILRGEIGDIIMAHPPDLTSDLSFKDFIHHLSTSKKGIKCDFKDASVVEECAEIIKSAELNQPVIMNADIAMGPGATLVRCEAAPFLKACQQHLPEAMVSVGWTTQHVDGPQYTAGMVDEVLDHMAGWQGHVTYGVRIMFAEESWSELQRLLSEPERSITFWNNEPVTEQQKAWLDTATDPSRCFYDISI